MLPTYVRLHDVDDVEGFVCKTIEKSGLRGSIEESEREELMAAGITIMYELAGRYEPHRAGYATSGRFSGFAAQFLPRRLGDEWHKMHPEHRRITDADGKRRWVYASSPLSLDDLTGSTGRHNKGANENSSGDAIELAIRPREQWAPVPAV